MKRLLTLGLFLLTAAVVYSFVNKTGEKNDAEPFKVGDVVEDFSLMNVDGEKVSMESFPEAKGYIIMFTCNTCPVAKDYEQRIIELDERHSKNGWQLIAIQPNDPAAQPGDSFELMQERAKEKGYGFPYLMDEGQKVYPKWGATKTPHAFIVQNTSAGAMLRYIGAIDDNRRDASAVKVNYIDDAIAAMENNELPNPSETRAIGCSIKVK